MGYNSTILIVNDRLDEIERDPDFGKKISDAIRHFSRSDPNRMPYVTGQTQVIDVAHADNLQIIAVGGNTGRVIRYGHYRDSDDAIIKALDQRIVNRVAAEMRRQCGKSTDAPWDAVSQRTKDRWHERALAVLRIRDNEARERMRGDDR